MDDKVSYVDCLINISICDRETENQESRVAEAIKAVEEYFPTYADIKENLYEESILDLYLNWIDILENKASSGKLSQD